MGYSNTDILYPYSSMTPDYSSLASSSDITTVLGAMLGGFLGLFIVIAIAIVVLQIVANWKIFTKAGEKGWKAIIPFYNTAILYKISGMSPWLALLYIGLFIPVINVFVCIAFAVLNLYQPINLAKGFKKSTGFTVGMIMLPFIFDLILAFGKSEYIGFDEANFSKTTSPETKAE